MKMTKNEQYHQSSHATQIRYNHALTQNKMTFYHDLSANFCEMTIDELKQTLSIVTELYTKYDALTDTYNGINEHFRVQIDLIVSVLMSEHDLTHAQCFE